MELALVVAKRSTCLRQKVGALIVKDRRILATGYNGAPSSMDHCLDIGCLREKLNVPSGERIELCLTPDVEVLTEDGFKKIGEIKAGCKVLTHSGKYADVTRVFCRDYKGIVCIIKPRGLLPVTVTPEHEVLAIKRSKETTFRLCRSMSKDNYEDEEDWIPAILLNRGDLLVFGFDTRINSLKYINLLKYIFSYYKLVRKKSKGNDVFKTQNGINCGNCGSLEVLNDEFSSIPMEVEVSKDLMWLFGIYLAEGCSSYNQIAFSLNRNGEAERIIEIMKDYFGLKPYEKSSIVIKYSSKILAEVFANMFGKNTYEMRIPSELMTLKPSLQKHILYGWLKGYGDLKGITASKALALQMFQICLRLGIIPTLSSGWDGKTYMLRVKNKNLRLKKGRLYTPVDEVKTRFYRGKVYNLEVDKDQSFSTESFIVHNCRGLHAEQNAIIQAAKFGISIEGSTMYTTHCPCITCAKMIINAGIKKVVYGKDYADRRGLDLLREAGIEVVYLPIDSLTES